MHDLIKNIIIQYVQNNANMEEWRSIRKCYFWYSYLAFVNLYIIEKGYTNKELAYKELVNKNILDCEVLCYFNKISDRDKFFIEIQCLEKGNYDLSILYQEYISKDFYVDENGIFYIGRGKNSRDILGSYYTQNDFSKKIIEMVLENYIRTYRKAEQNNRNIRKDIKEALLSFKYVDSSCGSGEFLVSIIRYIVNNYDLTLKEREEFINKIYGYDVDPVAVFITRVRIMEELHLDYSSKNIQLGNPLVPIEGKNVSDKYMWASQGRFYNMGMGISIPDGKYDIIVGNPPWEKIRFEEKKFLVHYINNQIDIDKKSDRDFFISMKISNENAQFFYAIKRDYEIFKSELKKSKIMEWTACGELNTYALFTEWAVNNISDSGWISLIVKNSLLKSQVYSRFFSKLMNERMLYEAYMFINKRKIFQIDSREEFAVVFLSKRNKENLKIIMNLETVESMEKTPKLELSLDILRYVNPITGMIPNVKTHEELEFLVDICMKHNMFNQVYPGCKYGRIVHLTNHSTHIVKRKDVDSIPIYEGKFIEQYNNHYATYCGVDDKEKYAGKSKAKLLSSKIENVECRYFINEAFWKELSKGFDEDFCIVWRSLTSATNTRTMIATLLPKMPTCQSIQLLQISDKKQLLHILAIFNSIIFDYLVRLKMAGLDLTQTIIKQIPVPQESNYQKIIMFKGREATIEEHIFARIKELYAGDALLGNFFDDIITYKVKEKNSKGLMAEIDMLIGMAYEISMSKLVDIVKQFQKFYSKEEIEALF